ncbi:MFS transporter [Deinococcus cellulosilyticus]|uniref:Nitrate/nitrite transporter n=1 Tax=Deinococcus cellulosilyticus (strain DSM 18568 / NBRC 106333 / KACC 11606 / 5516J-15) TaxID=1223518 RepID=A0A511N1Q8_DEIC1|nr:MFS transporter [Deinococcus cellulosilyticus]GEM46286.1 nitrate/nitrite transporter [Deinococcus cellulosilyticus NBRC 106333 = KACC 11606]
MQTTNRNPSTYLQSWTPEDPQFWEGEGKSRAWRTLWITTFNLVLAFATWFMVSAIVTRLQGVGFNLTTEQLFWLTAMPGLAAGTLRIVHTFMIPRFGSRHTITWATLSLLIPVLGWGIAVQDPGTPYWVLLLLSFLAGLGGGNFSSFMPSTTLFFPKRLQGTALGIQAGIGNFGVSLAQFLTPWVVGVNLFWFAPGGYQNWTFARKTETIWLQNAAWVYIPFIVFGALLAWMLIRSVPLKAGASQLFTIFKEKHTWVMTSIYLMTFGVFSGLSSAFPLMIKTLYGGFENPPLPLAYAFYGPLIGSAVRVIFGMIADRTGGAILTTISGTGMLASAIFTSFYVTPESMAEFPYFVGGMLAIFFFSGIGNASTFRQMPVIFPPTQAAGVIGWTAAIAAYGPFIVSMLINLSNSLSGSPVAFFYLMSLFFVINIFFNWYFYGRRGAERPS